jgi:hypothetical protein
VKQHKPHVGVKVMQKHPVCYVYGVRRNKSQNQATSTGRTLRLSLRIRYPINPRKGKRALNFDAKARPHNTPESQGLRWRYTASTENNATNVAKEERRCGGTKRHEALIETRAPDHTATT